MNPTNPLVITKKPTNMINFLIGLFFCLLGVFFIGFSLYFLATGYDEIWNGYRVWWMGIGIASLSASFGVTSLFIVLSPVGKVPKILKVLIGASLLLLLFGILKQ